MPLNPNGKIIGYDVQLMGLGNGDTMLLSIESDSTFSAIHNDYQILGTTVQVCRYKNVNILYGNKIINDYRSVLRLQLGQEIGVKNYH